MLGGGLTKNGERTKNARMATLGVIYTLRRLPDGSLEGPLNKRVIGTFGGARALFRRLANEAQARGYGQKETIFLADGARTLWSLQREFFPAAITCVDWYHLCQYIWRAGSDVFPECSEELELWVSARKREVLAGELDTAFEAIHSLRAQCRRPSQSKRGLNACLRYMEGNWQRMPYAELVARGIEIATGAIEGAVKHVAGTRLDGSGMRWSRHRAEQILALRCVVVNQDWRVFAEHAMTRHEELRIWQVPRVTPVGPLKPYDAVPKVT